MPNTKTKRLEYLRGQIINECISYLEIVELQSLKDNNKNNAIIQQNYNILIIWEYDYKQDKQKVIQKCIDFIKN